MTEDYRIRCGGPWPACGHANNKCTACPSYQAAITVKKPAPAPEGEAIMCRLCSMGLKECDCISEPLYASPVVPAEVSREEIAAIVLKAIETAQVGDNVTFLAADAIIAALRPTDTGTNHD